MGIDATQLFAIDCLPLQPGDISRPHLARCGIVSVQRLIMASDLLFDGGLIDIVEDTPQGRRTRQARLGGRQGGQQFSRIFPDPVSADSSLVLNDSEEFYPMD
jgi:hypothetical protein